MTETENDTYRKGGAVAGLAREVEQLRRQVARMAPADEVVRLAKVVTELEASLVKPPAQAEAVPSWLGLGNDTEHAETLLSDLVTWMGSVYLRYADGAKGLPECWLWHGEVVEELAWLMGAWHEAYGDHGAARAAGDWNDRLRPGVVRRIRDVYAPSCSLENHLPQHATVTRAVPFADTADQIVAWWTTTRAAPGPSPTDAQLAEAAEAARRACRGGNPT